MHWHAMQVMPGWLMWYTLSLNPVYYSLHGLISSQLGDVEDVYLTNNFSGSRESVADFIRGYFGYKHSFLGWDVLILFVFNMVFRAVIAVATKYLHWQKR